MDKDIIAKKCCGLCPYSNTNTLYLIPERAEEMAYAATNPYNDFVCHKTADVDEDGGDATGDFIRGERSAKCHGFAVLQDNENSNCLPEKFKRDPHTFVDAWEMIEHHTEYHEEQEAIKRSTSKE